jgi:hypothetical protein
MQSGKQGNIGSGGMPKGRRQIKAERDLASARALLSTPGPQKDGENSHNRNSFKRESKVNSTLLLSRPNSATTSKKGTRFQVVDDGLVSKADRPTGRIREDVSHHGNDATSEGTSNGNGPSVSSTTNKKNAAIIATKANRSEAVLQKRERLDRERTKAMLIASKSLRGVDNNEAKLERKRLNDLLMYVVISSRIDAMLESLSLHREKKKIAAWEHRCALVITQAMRRNYFIEYRKRIKAWTSLSIVIGVKLGKWKRVRKQKSVKIIMAFLNCLEAENTLTNGCLSVISKSKTWVTYKNKVVNLQRFLRKRKLLNCAQAALLDRLWHREHQRLIDIEVDAELHRSDTRIAKRNKEIATLNFTRQRNRRRLLNPERPNTRENIRERFLVSRESDILTPFQGEGIPDMHIRSEVIHEVIRCAKRLHMHKVLEIDRQRARLRSEMKQKIREAKRNDNTTPLKCPHRRITNFESPSAKTPKTRNFSCCLASAHERADVFQTPLKSGGAANFGMLNGISNWKYPHFHLLLGHAALSKMVELTEIFVSELRMAWAPAKLEYKIPRYEDIGKQVAHLHCAALHQEEICIMRRSATNNEKMGPSSSRPA